jgi:hypothetical protein
MQISISNIIKGNFIGSAFATISRYFTRVTNDGGIYEAPLCVETAINGSQLLQRASLLLVPSGYKATKLYSQIPTSGAGDSTWTRASNGTRTNSSGVIETMGNNVPRLTYLFGSCPGVLVEGQRTNLVFPSDTATTQTRAVTSTPHTLTFYGTGTVVLSGVAVATLTGTGANDRVSLTFTPSSGNLILTVSGTVTNWQLEAGAFASTLIPTTSASATRLADTNVISGISSLIGQTQGVVFFDMYYNLVTNGGFRIFACLEGTVGSVFSGITIGTSSNANNIQYAGAGYTFPSTGRYKVACLYNSTTNTSKLFVNGVLRSTSTFAGFANTVSQIAIGARINTFAGSVQDRQAFVPFYNFAIFPTALTDAECVAITT